MVKSIRDFLTDIATNEIIQGKAYDERIAINDGGVNSYIALSVYTEGFRRKTPVTSIILLHRHTNNVDGLNNTWEFQLGDSCHAYADYPRIPIRFASYGKTIEVAESEAKEYFKELKRLIKKQTSDYKIQVAASAEEERARILARLSELESAHD